MESQPRFGTNPTSVVSYEDFESGTNGTITPDNNSGEYVTQEYLIASGAAGFEVGHNYGPPRSLSPPTPLTSPVEDDGTPPPAQHPRYINYGSTQQQHQQEQHLGQQQHHQHHHLQQQQQQQQQQQVSLNIKNNNFANVQRIIPNLRHSGLLNHGGGGGNPDAERAKLEKKRERNRIAATKCRMRKLEKISTLETQVSRLRDENKSLQDLSGRLSKDLDRLREQLEYHVQQGCQDLHPETEVDEEQEVKPLLGGDLENHHHGFLSQEASSNVMLCEAAPQMRPREHNPDSTCLS